MIFTRTSFPVNEIVSLVSHLKESQTTLTKESRVQILLDTKHGQSLQAVQELPPKNVMCQASWVFTEEQWPFLTAFGTASKVFLNLAAFRGAVL